MMISAPGPYEGQVFPALLVNQSSLMLDGTEWNVSRCAVLRTRSMLNARRRQQRQQHS